MMPDMISGGRERSRVGGRDQKRKKSKGNRIRRETVDVGLEFEGLRWGELDDGRGRRVPDKEQTQRGRTSRGEPGWGDHTSHTRARRTDTTNGGQRTRGKRHGEDGGKR